MIDDPVIVYVMIALLVAAPIAYITSKILDARNQANFDKWVAEQNKYRIEADAWAKRYMETQAISNAMTSPTASRVSVSSTTVRRENTRAVSVATFDDSDNVLTGMLVAQSVRNDDDVTAGTVSWVDDTPIVVPDTTPSYSSSYTSGYSSDSGSSYSSSSSDSSYSSSSDSSSYSSD